MHDINTINRLNAEQIAHEALHHTQAGKFVVVRYEGLAAFNCTPYDTLQQAEQAASEVNPMQGESTKVLHPTGTVSGITRDQTDDRGPGYATAEDCIAATQA